MSTNKSDLGHFVNDFWDKHILPALSDFVRIPALSVAFDSDWQKNGLLEEALIHVRDWVEAVGLEQCTVERIELEGFPACIWIEIKGSAKGEVLCYAHYDKQPENDGWSDGLSAWEPIIRDGKLYGRGAADDGYAMFSYIAAIAALQQNGLDYPTTRILFEGAEESGSPGLDAYLAALAPRLGTPDLVCVLDSGCADYERIWCTTSLRGMVGGVLDVSVLTQGVHSGGASGIVPSSFRIARQLLDRIEAVETGEITVADFTAEIPNSRVEQAKQLTTVVDDSAESFPFVDKTKAMTNDVVEQQLNRTWRAFLSVTGADGLPPSDKAGNVLRTHTALKLSLRLPPTVNAQKASELLGTLLTENPPYDATITFTPREAGQGWNAPEEASWLLDAVNSVSQRRFNNDAMFIGEGGSIPLMAMLQKRFPQAQFLVSGVLGPLSNAHGPNEFLHIDVAKALTECVSVTLNNLATHKS